MTGLERHDSCTLKQPSLVSRLQRFLQSLRDIVGRMTAGGGRGPGLGLKLLMGAGALVYGVKEATYTGKAAAPVVKK